MKSSKILQEILSFRNAGDPEFKLLIQDKIYIMEISKMFPPRTFVNLMHFLHMVANTSKKHCYCMLP